MVMDADISMPRMNVIFLLIAFLFLYGFDYDVSADVYSNSTLNVSVDIIEPTVQIEIIPSSVYLGKITKGYATDALNLDNPANITFINKGDLKISITPTLSSNVNPIFKNLEFNTASCSSTSTSWHSILSWTGLSIDRPDSYGSSKSDYSCVRLNLKNYNQTINGNESLTTQLTIWVMPG